MRKSPVVGQQNQALTLLVEPPDMKEAPELARHKVKDGRPFPLIGTCAHDPLRFVQEKVRRAGRPRRRFSGDSNIVTGLNNCRKIPNEVAVDRDLSVPDKGLAGSTGTKARGGQIAVQAHDSATSGRRQPVACRRCITLRASSWAVQSRAGLL